MEEIKIAADEILRKKRENWDEPKVYPITVNQAVILIGAGAKIKSKDAPADGTYRYHIKYRKQLFVCTCQEKI